MTGVTYLGESSPFGVVIGNSQTGVSIGYGACLSGTIQLLTVRFFGQGLTEPCCVYPVGPDRRTRRARSKWSTASFQFRWRRDVRDRQPNLRVSVRLHQDRGSDLGQDQVDVLGRVSRRQKNAPNKATKGAALSQEVRPSFFPRIALGIPTIAPCLQVDARVGDTHTPPSGK